MQLDPRNQILPSLCRNLNSQFAEKPGAQALTKAAYCSSVKGTTDNLPILTSGDWANNLFPLICASETASGNALPALIFTCGFFGSLAFTDTTVAVPTPLL